MRPFSYIVLFDVRVFLQFPNRARAFRALGVAVLCEGGGGGGGLFLLVEVGVVCFGETERATSWLVGPGPTSMPRSAERRFVGIIIISPYRLAQK